jgi:hypothetical protein
MVIFERKVNMLIRVKELDLVLWEQIASDNSLSFYFEPIPPTINSVQLSSTSLEPQSNRTRYQSPLCGSSSPLLRHHSIAPMNTSSEHLTFSSGESSISCPPTMTLSSRSTSYTASDEPSLQNPPKIRTTIASHDPGQRQIRKPDASNISQAIASNHQSPQALNELVQMPQTRDTALVCSHRYCQNKRFNHEIEYM